MNAVRKDDGITYIKLGAIVFAAILHTTTLVVGSFTVFATNDRVDRQSEIVIKVEKDSKEYARTLNEDTQHQLADIKQEQKEQRELLIKIYRESSRQ